MYSILKKSVFTLLFCGLFINLNAQTKKPLPAKAVAKPAAKSAVVSKTFTVGAPKPITSSLKTQKDSLSYSIGVNIGENLKNQKLDVNSDVIAQAIADVIQGKNQLMAADACNGFLQNYFQKEGSKVGNENKAKGDAFLAQNKSKEGIKITASGLQYKIVNEGSGPKPQSTDKVKVHYHGTLIDGTVFDSSVNRGEPTEFGVTQVIQGWVEALQLMPVGSKWTLYIPSALAYGQQGPPSIGPNQVLVFDVELLDIVKQ